MRIPTFAEPARRDRRQRPWRAETPDEFGVLPAQLDADDSDDGTDDGADDADVGDESAGDATDDGGGDGYGDSDAGDGGAE